MEKPTNKIGYHTPEKTKEVLDLFNKEASVKWEDSSWYNDGTDSIMFRIEEGIYLHIFIPHGDYETFLVSDERQSNIFESKDVTKVLDFIKGHLLVINTVKEAIDENIDQIFFDTHSELETVSGDISPEQAFELDEIKIRLQSLVVKQVSQNLK
jgi:hypothetical protein